jgi:hypothetical protein
MKTLAEVEDRVRRAFRGDAAAEELVLERVRALAAGQEPPRKVGWLLHARADATLEHVEAAAWALGRGRP